MNPARLKRLIAGLQEGMSSDFLPDKSYEGPSAKWSAATLYETKTAAGKDGEVDEMSVVLGA